MKYNINYNNNKSDYLFNNSLYGLNKRIIESFTNNNDYCNINYGESQHDIILPPVDRIIVIGDLHGDLKLTLKCLKIAQVIPKNYDINLLLNSTSMNFDEIEKPLWIGGTTNVVQVGDQVDRCRPIPGKSCLDKNTTKPDENSDLKIMKLFWDLKKQAQKVGGEVYSLLGNHEIMNIIGNLSYVSYDGIHKFNEKDPETGKIYKGYEGRKQIFAPGSYWGKRIACTFNSIITIGSNMFVHAGIAPELQNLLLSGEYNLVNLNEKIQNILSGYEKLDDKINDKYNNSSLLTNYKISPFWPRALGNLPENEDLNNNEECLKNFKPLIDKYNIKNLVIGHTPQSFKTVDPSNISATCTNKNNLQNSGVWRVDVGASRAFGAFTGGGIKNTAAVLEILNDGEKINILTN